MVSTATADTYDLKRGDIVVMSMAITGPGVTVSVNDPAGGVALMPQGITAVQFGGTGTGKFSFQASQDGKYILMLESGMMGVMGGAVQFNVTITTDIYR